jgi:hypothetical protein
MLFKIIIRLSTVYEIISYERRLKLDENSIKKLFEYIEASKNIISNEAYLEVRHFYDHGEYEMAFEGLIIELDQGNKYPQDFKSAEWENLGMEFGLDKESVFDIWDKLIKWSRRFSYSNG